MEIYFPIKDFDSHYKRYYELVDFNGKRVTSNYKGMFGLALLAKDVASKIKNKELGDYLIVDMSLGLFQENNSIKKFNPLNSLEYEFFHIFVRANLKKEGKKI
jgi:hypothetical protein